MRLWRALLPCHALALLLCAYSAHGASMDAFVSNPDTRLLSQYTKSLNTAALKFIGALAKGEKSLDNIDEAMEEANGAVSAALKFKRDLEEPAGGRVEQSKEMDVDVEAMISLRWGMRGILKSIEGYVEDKEELEAKGGHLPDEASMAGAAQHYLTQQTDKLKADGNESSPKYEAIHNLEAFLAALSDDDLAVRKAKANQKRTKTVMLGGEEHVIVDDAAELADVDVTTAKKKKRKKKKKRRDEL